MLYDFKHAWNTANTLVKCPMFFKDSPSPQHKTTSELEALEYLSKGIDYWKSSVWYFIYIKKKKIPIKKENTH